MRSKLVRRGAALALVVALVAPTAGALPGKGVAGPWEWFWEWWGGGTATREGSCGVLGDKPCGALAAPASAPPAGQVATKEGPCIISDGKPCTSNTLAEPEPERRPLQKEVSCMRSGGQPCPSH